VVASSVKRRLERAGRAPWFIIRVVARFLAAVTGSARWRYRLGVAEEYAGSLDAAATAYDRASASLEAPKQWWATAARVHEARGDWGAAEAAYRAAAVAFPGRVEFALGLVRALNAQGAHADARSELQRVLPKTTDLPVQELIDVAAALERAGQRHEAIELLEAARMQPGGAGPKLLARLARAYRREGLLEQAEGRCAEGLASNPESVGLLREYAEVATASKQWDNAARRWQRVLEARPDRADAKTWSRLVAALRSSGRGESALDALTRARADHPSDLGLLLEDALTSLGEYGRAGEDARHAWKERLVAAEQQLSSTEDEAYASKRATRVLGNLQLRLRQWDAAAATWREVELRFPDRHTEACLKQARAHRSAGKEAAARSALPEGDPARHGAGRAEDHFVAAWEALDRVDPAAAAMSEHYRAETRALAAQYGKWSANHAGVCTRLLYAAEKPEAADDRLRGALLTRGYTPSQIREMAPILEELKRLITSGDARTSKTPTPQNKIESSSQSAPERPIVLISGFLYSGSGAAYDYLRQHSSAAEPFGTHELWVLKKTNNFGQLLVEANRLAERFPRVALASILTNVWGFGQMSYPLSVYFEDGTVPLADFSSSVCTLVTELTGLVQASPNGTYVERPGVEIALQKFFADMIRLLTPPDKTPLLNNVVPAFQLLDYMGLFNGSRAVVVGRDPRDQYVSQRLESPYSRGCDDFVAMMHDRYDDFDELIGSHLRDRVFPVRFENFVSDRAVREETTAWTGLSPFSPAGDQSFDAARSQRNVGIFRNHPARDEIEMIAEELMPRYESLFPPRHDAQATADPSTLRS
jgi:lipopolysaccharide biosynthesis regulator YciM